MTISNEGLMDLLSAPALAMRDLLRARELGYTHAVGARGSARADRRGDRRSIAAGGALGVERTRGVQGAQGGLERR